MKPYYQDKWVTILCGDSREILPTFNVGDYFPHMTGSKVDLVLTDPPYGINACHMQLGSGLHKFQRGQWDDARPVDLIRKVIGMNTKTVIWGGNYYTDILPMNNDWLVWHKLNDGLSFSECELAWSNLGRNTRVFSKYVANIPKLHPTQKPDDVFMWCIELAGDFIEVILDPFLGSGTACCCAKRLNRKSIGIEIEEKYCEIAAQRCMQEVMVDPRIAEGLDRQLGLLE